LAPLLRIANPALPTAELAMKLAVPPSPATNRDVTDVGQTAKGKRCTQVLHSVDDDVAPILTVFAACGHVEAQAPSSPMRFL